MLLDEPRRSSARKLYAWTKYVTFHTTERKTCCGFRGFPCVTLPTNVNAMLIAAAAVIAGLRKLETTESDFELIAHSVKWSRHF